MSHKQSENGATLRNGGFFQQLCDFTECVAVLQVYLDESERESGVFCVAGWAFAPHQAKKFCKEWSQVFGEYPGGMHMRHLGQGTGPFRGIKSAERDRLMREAVKIIKRRVSAGFAVSCNVKEVERLAPRVRGLSHAYPLCCHLSMIAVGQFVSKSSPYESVTYVFEAGHLHQNEAMEFMRNVIQNPDVTNAYRYSGHAFLPKSDAVPLQAADMLAWEWAKFRDETYERGIRPIRKSLRSLFEAYVTRYSGAHITGPALAKFTRQVNQILLEENKKPAIAGG